MPFPPGCADPRAACPVGSGRAQFGRSRRRGTSGVTVNPRGSQHATSSPPRRPSVARLPRVLFVSEGNAETHDSWSGVSRSVVLHLRALGHEVRVVDADLYGAARVRVALRTLAWPRKRWWVRYHLHAAAFAARSAACAAGVRAHPDADVILQVGATFEPPAGGLPVVLYCDSNIVHSLEGVATGQSEAAVLSARELRHVREREARVYARAATILTMSHRVQRSFRDAFAVPAERLETVHCGPNIPLPVLEEPDPVRPPTVLFLGRDFDRKGGPLLLAAFREVRTVLPDARLVVVGGRPAGSIDAPGVEFLGVLSRDEEPSRLALDAAYRSAHVCCIPTRFEPFGTAFVEAMLYGLPCIGPNAWAVPEIIVPGETGTLVPPDDVAALSGALLDLLRDPARSRRMGLAARRRAEREFTWESLTARISAALRRAADARPLAVRTSG